MANQFRTLKSLAHPCLTGLISSCVAELEPNARSALEEDLGKPFLMSGE